MELTRVVSIETPMGFTLIHHNTAGVPQLEMLCIRRATKPKFSKLITRFRITTGLQFILNEDVINELEHAIVPR